MDDHRLADGRPVEWYTPVSIIIDIYRDDPEKMIIVFERRRCLAMLLGDKRWDEATLTAAATAPLTKGDNWQPSIRLNSRLF
jgi:hypothetical protein